MDNYTASLSSDETVLAVESLVKHRSCSNCLYAHMPFPDRDGVAFQCRLMPPSPEEGWPRVGPSSWCGQFQMTSPTDLKRRDENIEKYGFA
jgi:hypothetical protein